MPPSRHVVAATVRFIYRLRGAEGGAVRRGRGRTWPNWDVAWATAPGSGCWAAAKAAALCQHLTCRLLVHASAEHLQMQLRYGQLRYGQLRRLPTQAKASQAYTGAIRPKAVPEWARQVGQWPGAPSGLNQRGPQSALSISFEPLCTLQSVGLQLSAQP